MKTFYREAKDLGNGLKRITYYSQSDMFFLDLLKLPFVLFGLMIIVAYLVIKWGFVILPYRLIKLALRIVWSILKGIGSIFKMIFHRR